jgi:hypothetical protein
MPNGIIIPLVVKKNATIQEIKEVSQLYGSLLNLVSFITFYYADIIIFVNRLTKSFYLYCQ